MRNIFSLIFFLCLITLSQLTAKAQDAIPHWIVEDWEFRTQGSGTWIADNGKYKSENEPFEAYGIRWEWGLGKKSVKGRLYCIKDGKDVYTAWHFVDYWDPETKELKLLQMGEGSVGQGKMWLAEDGVTKSLQKFTAMDGTSFESGHKAWIKDGDSYTQSFKINKEEWTPNRLYVWKLKK